MSMQEQISFTRLGISLPCPVPVVPGTPDTMRDGQAIPLSERTETCAVDAFWAVGGQPTCDVHLRVVCEILDVDYEDLLEEAGGPAHVEELPWDERYRYDQ